MIKLSSFRVNNALEVVINHTNVILLQVGIKKWILSSTHSLQNQFVR